MLACAVAAFTACALVTGLSEYDVTAGADGAVPDSAPPDAVVREDAGPPLLPEASVEASVDGSIDAGTPRVTNGLLALYTFEEGSGDVVRDVSGTGAALNLSIVADGGAVEHGPTGLTVRSPSLITSNGAPTKIVTACQATNEITLEAWSTPASNADAIGRIAGMGSGFGDLNFTLNTEGNRYATFIRTAAAAEFKALFGPTGGLTVARAHVVALRTVAGDRVLYVNGTEVARDRPAADFGVWRPAQPFTMANDPTMALPWRGTLHLVAVYGRALTPAEIAQNFTAEY